MARLSADKKSVLNLFMDKESDFVIPEYQRPYAWTKDQCQALWDDICSFAFPGVNKDQASLDVDDTDSFEDKFDKDDEYYLGSIVIYQNAEGKYEVIDGQQRITSLMLLLRAFYAVMMPRTGGSEEYDDVVRNIKKCIWKVESGKPLDFEKIKLDSNVIDDDHKRELRDILTHGNVDGYSSNYAKNYKFFKSSIEEFSSHFTDNVFIYLPIRIMENCIVLPITADSQNTALRIFSTLNNRGIDLRNSDIFKAEFYKYFKEIGEEKDFFIPKWKDLINTCEDTSNELDIDELFFRHMYFKRAQDEITDTSTIGIRPFYEGTGDIKYTLLKSKKTFFELRILADFWDSVYNLDDTRLSDDIRQRLFVLKNATNNMWKYFVSVYFLTCVTDMNIDHDLVELPRDWNLDSDAFVKFLEKTIAFFLGYMIVNPGATTSSYRSALYPEMANIAHKRDVTFGDNLFMEDSLREKLSDPNIFAGNKKGIVRFVLSWWTFYYSKEHGGSALLLDGCDLNIEHIFSRQANELTPIEGEELIGNKALLEAGLNKSAKSLAFPQKRELYMNGYKKRPATNNKELYDIAEHNMQFDSRDIKARGKNIIDGFLAFLRENSLLR